MLCRRILLPKKCFRIWVASSLPPPPPHLVEIFVETKVVDLGGTLPICEKKIYNRVFEGLRYICRVNNTYFHEKL